MSPTSINSSSPTLTGLRVDDVHGLRHPEHDAHLSHVAELLGESSGQAHDAVLDHRHNLHGERELVVVRVAVDVVRDQLLGLLVTETKNE